MPKINIICKECGSEAVLKDANAKWDREKQEWVLLAVYDHTACSDCGADNVAKEVPL